MTGADPTAPVDAAAALAQVVETCRADLARLLDRHDAAVELGAMCDDLAAALRRPLLDPDDLLAAARAVDALTEARVRALLARITNGDPTP